MVKNKIEDNKAITQAGVRKSYIKLALVLSFTVAVLVLVVSVGRGQITQQDSVQKVELPRVLTAEEEIAKRVPRLAPRAPGEVSNEGELEKPSMQEVLGVQIQPAAPRPPVRITLSPQDASTAPRVVEMRSNGGVPALAVDAEGYAILPNGKRVKVTPTGPAATAFAVPQKKEPSVMVGPLTREDGLGAQESKNKEYGDTLEKLRIGVDAEGYALLPNGKRMVRDTSGSTVDAQGTITLSNGMKIEAGGNLNIRIPKNPDWVRDQNAKKRLP